jgi:hypothetical protein
MDTIFESMDGDKKRFHFQQQSPFPVSLKIRLLPLRRILGISESMLAIAKTVN